MGHAFCNINVGLNQKSFQGFKSEMSNEEVYQMESPYPPPKTAPPKILALLAFQIELWYFLTFGKFILESVVLHPSNPSPSLGAQALHLPCFEIYS